MDACELSFLERAPIAIELARRQHRAYEACLAEFGVRVISLPAETEYPDAVFVEDPAIVLDEIAVLTRTGAESRRGESDSLARELKKFRTLRWMQPPGTLDGGDVMRVDRTLYAGRSGRSSPGGIQQLAAEAEPFGYRVQPVDVQGCLHLKSGCSYLGDGMVLVYRPWVDAEVFAGLKIIDAPDAEAVNVLRVGDTVLIAAGFPKTAQRLAELGLRVRALDNSELRKAEGALTCCSLIFEST